MENDKFVIICKRHMRSNDPSIWFWGPNSSGYTNDLDQVGVYTEKEVEFTKNHESDDCPVLLETIISLKKIAVYEERKLISYVPNTAGNRKILGIQKKELLQGIGPYNFSSYEDPQEFLDRNKRIVALVQEVEKFLSQSNKPEMRYPEWDSCTRYEKGMRVWFHGELGIIGSTEIGVHPITVEDYTRREGLVPV